LKYLLFLDELSLTLSIGLHDFEKAAPQRLLVSVVLVVEMAEDAGDEAAAVYDYDGLRALIVELADQPHHQLQEDQRRLGAHIQA